MTAHVDPEVVAWRNQPGFEHFPPSVEGLVTYYLDELSGKEGDSEELMVLVGELQELLDMTGRVPKSFPRAKLVEMLECFGVSYRVSVMQARLRAGPKPTPKEEDDA